MDVSDEQLRPGQLVSARGREWIVLPTIEPGLVRLRPITGVDVEDQAFYLPVERERLRPATFSAPDTDRFGDAGGLLTLFDAARLCLRSGAAPLRSLSRISLAPRPYQFVPLLMALRLDPVRLLVADDVGVGKTIEAALVVRELLDRGLARRFAVLCPAHLGDQWRGELASNFALEAELVQPSTMARLERRLPRRDLSVYAWPRGLVASIDFIKSKQQRDAFLRDAPDLIVVDEAHGCARPRGNGGQQQRHELLQALAADPRRHLILVTATPHSGIEESFRSLLGLLESSLERVQQDRDLRKRLQPHLVQRRRKDVEAWLGAATPFPEREAIEENYQLTGAYQALYGDVLAYCQEITAAREALKEQQRRVRYWAALALLRCVLSSPATAAGVLDRRARGPGGAEDDPSAVDRTYRPQVLDDFDDVEPVDIAPAAAIEDPQAVWSESERRRLRDMASRARALRGTEADAKLAAVVRIVRRLLDDGHQPIVFCRFIDTAGYVAQHLAAAFAGVDVRDVTGALGDEERREKVTELTASPRRILVATDCLSEGINLQQHFDAVVHYDLPWNPNRLEQREGRVDRYGQSRPQVRTVLLYGADNEIDLVVLDVLLRKARAIKKALGVAVPVPAEAEQVVDALIDGVLLRGRRRPGQLELALERPDVSRLHAAWDKAAARQAPYFAQSAIDPSEVARELAATDDVLGDQAAVKRFMTSALQRLDGRLVPRKDGGFDLWPGPQLAPRIARAAGGKPLAVTFNSTSSQPGLTWLGRTHPLVAATSEAIIGEAFDATSMPPIVARSAALLTSTVARVTTVLLLRLRWLLRDGAESFAEEVRLVARETGDDGASRWLEPTATRGRELLASAKSVGELPDRRRHIEAALRGLESQWWRPLVEARQAELLEAHRRLCALTRDGDVAIEGYPPDVMGIAVLVPAVRGGRS